jgi:hypothetical protein
VSAAAVETLLARLYSDADCLRDFVEDPLRVSRAAGLDEREAAGMAAMDRTGLEMAAESYSRKRPGNPRKC